MVTTPTAHHCVAFLRAPSSMMPFPVATWPAHVEAMPADRASVPMPAAAPVQDTTVVANPWIGGSTVCGAGNGLSTTATFFGIATKRITPGHLEGMT